MLRVGPAVVAGVLRALFSTCRWEFREAVRHEAVRSGTDGPVILAFWHESMALSAYCYRNLGFYTLTSYSPDGEFAARVVRCFGNYALRGSSTRGGSEALKDMAVAARHRCLGITLDGPVGPRRKAKPGAAILSARSGTPIVPVAVVPVRAKRLRSWDRFPVPLPFSRIIYTLGERIPPPGGDSPAEIEPVRLRVEQAVNALHERIEAEVHADIG